MSGYDTVWKVQKRTDEGKGASRRLRRQGLVPGVIYGANKEPVLITIESNFIEHTIEDPRVYNTIINIEVEGGDNETAVLKEVQRHQVNGRVTHVDFQRIDENRKIKKRVPLRFVGQDTAPGVKMGGFMTFFLSAVEIRCYPKDLPTEIVVDVSDMMPATTKRLSDLALPEGVELTALLHGKPEYDQAVVAVSKPKIKK